MYCFRYNWRNPITNKCIKGGIGILEERTITYDFTNKTELLKKLQSYANTPDSDNIHFKEIIKKYWKKVRRLRLAKRFVRRLGKQLFELQNLSDMKTLERLNSYLTKTKENFISWK